MSKNQCRTVDWHNYAINFHEFGISEMIVFVNVSLFLGMWRQPLEACKLIYGSLYPEFSKNDIIA